MGIHNNQPSGSRWHSMILKLTLLDHYQTLLLDVMRLVKLGLLAFISTALFLSIVFLIWLL